eukprot:CAMPEP_0178388298 /NCGR_PEP_ID=MMETSP0689_2-20121128/9517_1 /TAXON_ID=160604 /ORGANISM="Amphidinium massartii, Strain CS-259" /LENGTH=105 /DNA_ID=CAMNT_0020008689 /DNA_START=98 /DNA_END=412 /DNA_ORIENTATION=+
MAQRSLLDAIASSFPSFSSVVRSRKPKANKSESYEDIARGMKAPPSPSSKVMRLAPTRTVVDVDGTEVPADLYRELLRAGERARKRGQHEIAVRDTGFHNTSLGW